ncbi:60S ribosomal export protein NMD3 [Planococcus citri]|uniref:60S ribosomal export protein NMD3 n=1 Tax=Planococcus citri TaxID=170843 RepID=UPI0031F7852E
MEYVTFNQTQGKPRILCCKCGVPIEPNAANMCIGCIRTQVDITEEIPKQVTLQFCRNCERYFEPPSEWISCALESRELLTICLNRLKGLNKVKLIDAGFIWTEPHSKRIKVKLTVQAEVMGGAILQQVFVVEYTIANQMCNDCHRSEAQDYWKALVQVRQKAENKKTFFYLEQLILKHKAHDNTIGIKPTHGGLDFFYSTEANARKMVDFLTALLPCRYQHSKRLISHDIHSNTYHNKFTYSVEIVPVSKDSVVCLSKKTANQLGGINSLCVVNRVTSAIHLIDPSSAQIAEVTSTNFWRDPFNAVCNPKQLTEFIVMNVEPIMDKDRRYFPGQGTVSNKHVLADIWVVKASDLGITETTIHTRSHLGHLLKPGDSALGYAIGDSNINDDNFEKLSPEFVPDVILVKKHYPERRRHRIWRLKHLQGDPFNLGETQRDYDEFMDDLEEDREYRQTVNIYKKSKVLPVDVDDMEDPNEPCITLEEMLDDLNIDEDNMSS